MAFLYLLILFIVFPTRAGADDMPQKLNESELREIGDLQKQYQILQAQLETLRLKLERVNVSACNRVGILIQNCEISPNGEIRRKAPTEKK